MRRDAKRKRGRRARAAVVVVAALAVLGVVLAVVTRGDDRDARAGSEEIDGDAGDLEIDPVESYQVTYRVEEGDRTSAERLTVRRPFESRLEVWSDEDLEAEPLSVDVTQLGRSSRDGSASGRAAVAHPPSVAPVDVRIERILDDTVQAGLIERRERRRVAGRTCQVLRSGSGLRAAEITPPQEDAWVDTCVDGDGVVVESVEVMGDEIVRRLLATAVDVELDALGDEAFDVGERTVPIADGGGATSTLTPESRPPGTFLELPASLPLPSFGRYAVVPPQPEVFADPLQRGRRVGSTTDVLLDGLDVVVVDRGGTLDGTDVIEPSPHGVPVDLGALGDGQIVFTPQGASVEVEQPGGRFVRVSGTLPVRELVALARSLREVEGGQLVPTGEPW